MGILRGLTEPGRGSRFRARMVCMLGALLAEGILLALTGLWLGGLSPFRARISSHHHRTSPVQWLAHPAPPLPAVVRHLQEPVFRPPQLPPLPRVARPAFGLLVQVRSLPRSQLRARIQNLTLSAFGAGDGSRTPGLWVDVPIPGAGGLPATGLSVVQTRYDCGVAETTITGLSWMEGRVNRAGRVVSARYLLRPPLPGGAMDDVKRWWSRIKRRHLRSLRRWRFAPLVLDGHPTGFRIILVEHVVYWRDLPVTRIYQGRSRRYMPCIPINSASDMVFTGRMPRWVLYPLNGHRPLAVLLAYGDRPVPGIAQATADVLRQVEKGTALEKTPGISR